MQAVVSTVLALSVAMAPAPTEDPRAIASEAADPGLVATDAAVPIGEAPDRAAAPPPQPEPEPAPLAAVPTTKGKSCFHERGQCRQLSILGIVFGTVGLASIGTGIGLLQKPNESIDDEPAYEISYEPPGVVAIGMGIGVLVTGILMIVAGQRAHKLGLDASARRRVRGWRWIRN